MPHLITHIVLFDPALERKASRHVTRQDDSCCALCSDMESHERGKQLERYQAAKLLKQKWTVWQLHIRDCDIKKVSVWFNVYLEIK